MRGLTSFFPFLFPLLFSVLIYQRLWLSRAFRARLERHLVAIFVSERAILGIIV